jgi:hypothetical protein
MPVLRPLAALLYDHLIARRAESPVPMRHGWF